MQKHPEIYADLSISHNGQQFSLKSAGSKLILNSPSLGATLNILSQLDKLGSLTEVNRWLTQAGLKLYLAWHGLHIPYSEAAHRLALLYSRFLLKNQH